VDYRYIEIAQFAVHVFTMSAGNDDDLRGGIHCVEYAVPHHRDAADGDHLFRRAETRCPAGSQQNDAYVMVDERRHR